jgi:hypothetical protein
MRSMLGASLPGCREMCRQPTWPRS